VELPNYGCVTYIISLYIIRYHVGRVTSWSSRKCKEMLDFVWENTLGMKLCSSLLVLRVDVAPILPMLLKKPTFTRDVFTFYLIAYQCNDCSCGVYWWNVSLFEEITNKIILTDDSCIFLCESSSHAYRIMRTPEEIVSVLVYKDTSSFLSFPWTSEN
jgi:hypothetical protein